MSGTLFLVATPIGNLEDLSGRALRILGQVAVIAVEDTRRTARLLARYRLTTPTTSLHEHNEARKTPTLLARLESGEDVAVVSDAGTPAVSDPGVHLIRSALKAGFRVESVPGPNAAITALAASGMAADTFLFLGFPPIRLNDRKRWLTSLRDAGRTVVFYEAPHRVRETLQQILVSVGDCLVCVGRELTKAHEELVVGPISSVIDRMAEPRGEYTVVVDIGLLTKYPQPSTGLPKEIGRMTKDGSAGEAPDNANSSTSTDKASENEPSDNELLREFGDITKRGHLPKRRAINVLARRHQRSPADVFAALGRAKRGR